MATAKKRTSRAKQDKGPKEPSQADRVAQAELATPLEPMGPGVEHEDHEGGITDSLARRGARAPLPDAEELAEQREEEVKKGIVRAPSVRERQTGMAASLARGGAVVQRDKTPAEEQAKKGYVPPPRGAHAVLAARKGARIVPVVATRLGQYPADGRLRAPGEAFDYVMGADEEKLPSWMQHATGEIESREPAEPSGTPPEPLVIEVRGEGAAATVTRGRATTGGRSVL